MKRFITLTLAAALMSVATSAVELFVEVPQGTNACYIAGDFNGWDANNALQMTREPGRYYISLPDVTTDQLAKGYKYLSGPDWKYVEKGPNGEEISNRTTFGNPDVVASWASVYYVNPCLSTFPARINGKERTIQVLVPADYDISDCAWPVVYYFNVKQRYSNSGDDNYAGDDLFDASSWGLANQNCAIFVQINCFVAECIPYATDEFMGSGQADDFIDGFIGKVIPHMENNYHTCHANLLMGADLGGQLALYLAMKHPDVFERCLAMSPLTWMNSSEMNELASTYAGPTKIFMTHGSLEPSVIRDNLPAVPGAKVMEIGGGLHNDKSWASAFKQMMGEFVDIYQDWDFSGPVNVTSAASAPLRAADISTTTYQLYSAIDSQNLAEDNNASFTYMTNYRKGSQDVAAKVLVRDIPVSVKTKFYWNVARMPEGTYLMSSNKDVSFSSKKNSVSWLRVAILDGETVENVAASSTAFTIQNASGKKTMEIVGDHRVRTTTSFANADKSFTIHYGSVNSGSDMGAITSTYKVSDQCTEATVEYDFLSNRVDITETSWGDVIDNVNLVRFSAVPSVTMAGESAKITIAIDEPQTYGATLNVSRNYGTASGLTLTKEGNNLWTADLADLAEGIYTLTLDLTRGTASKKEAATICVKVLPKAELPADVVTRMTVNAYADIDWDNVNRYKANFHTHTSQSNDCSFSTSTTVERYRNAGYKILALTDHDSNPYPWQYFDLYNPAATPVDPAAIGMLAVPGVELSKDNRNNWNMRSDGEYNHHNDFFTGRKGQEFETLRESYAYTMSLGGLQIINHPGQYWSLDKEYTPGEKNSPEWHIENFLTYPSLIGLEVYNQGNRRPNDRILWDRILSKTMPERPVWGYSCDDTHTLEQYFRNYEFMLMPELTTEALKEAMMGGHLYFSYEYTGSGNNLAPAIESITVDETASTITIDTDATDIKWISSTDKRGGASTVKSTVVGMGKTFDYTNFRGNYVRALITNSKGETCTQPFGFVSKSASAVDAPKAPDAHVSIFPNPAADHVNVYSDSEITRVEIYSLAGALVLTAEPGTTNATLSIDGVPSGVNVVKVSTTAGSVHRKLVVK